MIVWGLGYWCFLQGRGSAVARVRDGGGVVVAGGLENQGEGQMAREGGDGSVGRVTKEGADSTEGLLAGLLAGDAGAWRRAVTLYSGLLMGVSKRTFGVYGVEGQTSDHEEVAAAVWGNLLEHDMRVVRQCVGKGNFAATLTVLAKHRAVDLIRKTGDAHAEVGEIEPVTGEQEEPEDLGVDGKRLGEAMEKLPERQKMLLRLFYLQGKSYKEIHGLTGVAENSIGPTIARAVARLREMLGGEEER
jgi:RNA polymerase sigma-70 factor, ECF subfamily